MKSKNAEQGDSEDDGDAGSSKSISKSWAALDKPTRDMYNKLAAETKNETPSSALSGVAPWGASNMGEENVGVCTTGAGEGNGFPMCHTEHDSHSSQQPYQPQAHFQPQTLAANDETPTAAVQPALCGHAGLHEIQRAAELYANSSAASATASSNAATAAAAVANFGCADESVTQQQQSQHVFVQLYWQWQQQQELQQKLYHEQMLHWRNYQFLLTRQAAEIMSETKQQIEQGLV